MWLWIVFAGVIAVGFVAFTGAPYVPSRRKDVRRALTELYPLTSSDVLVDIGSGDGVVLREASKLGAKSVGYEIHPVLVLVARYLSRHDARVKVRLANFWRAPLPSGTTVVYVFGDSRDIEKMFARIEAEAVRIGKKIAFVSYGFELPNKKPAKTVGAHHLYYTKSLQENL